MKLKNYDEFRYIESNQSSIFFLSFFLNQKNELAYGNLANILSQQGRNDEAEQMYRKALEYRINMADVHYNL